MTGERECFACGRECEPDPHGPPWCGRCSGAAYAEQRADALEQSDDAAERLLGRRLLRAGRVPVAVEPRRTSWR